ncbi:hypothetical protein EX895_003084 [Sporisorium graminicola]|uniref:T6SS Phospholipase effector Tle1-like catalytic domain-containing protein n=1 Tax=Sporisorium graminicola TaxID=280036 RepID=A0A4U7KX22_9BASI|nr:hypothetical protein EX895_003084 [Sporisorium graminicola]TKY87988.1 hypothetical protein EX895_003084 [Sporisorium graminicola]
MVTLTATSAAAESRISPPPLASLQAPLASLPPPPLQPRVPRAPIRIIVLCDGTAQARNWVKTTLNTATRLGHGGLHASSTLTNDADRGDQGDRKRNSSKAKTTASPAAESGDFFTNVALLAKCISQSSGVATTSPTPPQSPTLGSNGTSTQAADADAADSTNKTASGVMAQLVFYQSGVGTGTGKLQNLFDQGTGFALGSKIEEAYSFIVDNYQPGDELFFFGFSRGAYTARCITGFINWCGVLNKVEMTHFADIWAAYQRRDPDDIASEAAAAEVLYAATQKYPSAESESLATSMYVYNLEHNAKLSDAERKALLEGRKRECAERRKRSMIVPPQIKVVGVWDTVSALGFPGLFQDNAMIDFFDFYDPGLGSNIQFGFHALSLEEDRKDFLPTMWYQPSVASTPSGNGEISVRGQHMRSKQLLKQCWFQGVHTDCGGGYQWHGLSDLTLIWMVSQLVDPHVLPDGSTTLRPLLNIDLGLLATILDRRREWAQQPPHRSRPTVNYQHARTVCQRSWDAATMKRTVWANMAKSGATHESIHASVVRGGRLNPDTSPQFTELRRDDAEGLKRMWEEAQDWQNALRPTEKLLYWERRGPYPWIPQAGDAYMNPLLAPLIISGGWNIPELAGRAVKDVVISAARERLKVESASMDVDDSEEVPHGNSDGAADVDDQPLEGWGETTAPTPTITKTTTVSTTTSNPSTAPPQQAYPLIPSKELGENPIDPSAHPHLHTLWQHLYSLSLTPNALVADLLNLRLVPRDNLNQTALQNWLWDLGDKLAGYPDDVKVQALTAGLLPSERRRQRRRRKEGDRVKGKDRKDAGKSVDL